LLVLNIFNSHGFRSAFSLGREAHYFSYHATPEVARGTVTESG